MEAERLDYPLDANSLVVDAGAYRSEFSHACHLKWKCRIVAFEPCKEFYDELTTSRVYEPPNEIRNVGLLDRNCTHTLYVRNDSTSLFLSSGQTEKVKLVDVADVMHELGAIDLLKLNIEGAEFPVLERLLFTGHMDQIRFLQVQFHHIGPGYKERRDRIRVGLAATHKEQWCKPFIWESWERK